MYRKFLLCVLIKQLNLFSDQTMGIISFIFASLMLLKLTSFAFADLEIKDPFGSLDKIELYATLKLAESYSFDANVAILLLPNASQPTVQRELAKPSISVFVSPQAINFVPQVCF